MKIKNYFLGGMGALLLAGTLVHGAEAAKAAAKPAGATDDLFPDKVLARGKGFEVKSSEVDAELLVFKTEVAMSGGTVPEARRAEFEKEILNRIIITRIMLSKATDEDKSRAVTRLDSEISKAKARLGSDEGFNRWVQARGQSMEEFRRRALDRSTIEEVYNREVKSKIVVADADIKKFYETNTAGFKQPEMVRVAHILKLTVDPNLRGVPNAKPDLSDDAKKVKRQEIEAILKKLRDGEDFTRLAKENSDDVPTKEKGGELPPFPRETMSVDFEKAAFSLDVGQISDIVTTKVGYHIIKVLEKIPAQQMEFDKVKDWIKERLTQEESNKVEPGYKEKLIKEAGVEYTK